LVLKVLADEAKDDQQGTGFGFSISKEFIEAQNGRINIEGEFGKGSTFTVTLNTLS
jgi:NtrC-family two-component system sensor histidine kinase KinB